MLTRARSLFSRVFSLDTPSTQIRLDDVFDDINDDSSDDNDIDNIADDDDDIDNPRNMIDNDDGGFIESDDEWLNETRQTSTPNTKIKGKYESQINESPAKTKTNLHYTRSHEKSKPSRLISAMQIATSRCNVESMKRLLTNFDIDINHRDQYGMSYLEHAILMGSFDMVDLLVRYGCDLYQG
jgi:ankyrin repeat protein